ncbi:MAG: hypothetical protein QNJ55_02050 [Xenococcus sp. MO_188.B8]|nr:hypothetical protein [Xenococcus sp. MO_188.B8]
MSNRDKTYAKVIPELKGSSLNSLMSEQYATNNKMRDLLFRSGKLSLILLLRIDGKKARVSTFPSRSQF